jgi:hypothetical protein
MLKIDEIPFQNPAARKDFQLSDSLDKTYIMCNISVAGTQRKFVFNGML